MTDELPLFPTQAPAVFRDRAAIAEMFDGVLARLAAVVGATGDAELQGRPTPCRDFDVAELRAHVLGWLQFFAAALSGVPRAERLDPTTWRPEPDTDGPALVRDAAADIGRAIADGAAEREAVMSQARMAGDGILGMALGEYIVHGWDLAVATGHEAAGDVDPAAAEAALAFLETMVAPEHRGPDGGFFDVEVPAPEGASALERLLCFAGRDPAWSPPS